MPFHIINNPAKHCKSCSKIIRGYNKSGFCSKCYRSLKTWQKKDRRIKCAVCLKKFNPDSRQKWTCQKECSRIYRNVLRSRGIKKKVEENLTKLLKGQQ